MKNRREGIDRVRRELKSLLIIYLLGGIVVALIAGRCASGAP